LAQISIKMSVKLFLGGCCANLETLLRFHLVPGAASRERERASKRMQNTSPAVDESMQAPLPRLHV